MEEFQKRKGKKYLKGRLFADSNNIPDQKRPHRVFYRYIDDLHVD